LLFLKSECFKLELRVDFNYHRFLQGSFSLDAFLFFGRNLELSLSLFKL